MQNKTDKGTSLVSKSLPVANSNSVNRSFSARKINNYVLLCDIIVSDDSEDYELYEERLLQIEKVIESLGEPTKSIFTKCYFDNKKYAEVAQEYGISSSGVKKHIMKVLGLIRKECAIRK